MSERSDVAVGSALLAFCTVAFFATTSFREVPAALSQNVPPTFFPRLVLIVIAALSLTLIAVGWKQPNAYRERTQPTVRVTAGIFVLAVALLPYIGMLATVCLAAIVLPVYWGERRLVPIVVLAVALPLTIHVIFAVALGMRFPRGVLW